MLSVSCVDKPPSTGQTADFRQYLCCWQTWRTGTARVEEIERENDRERESRKHRFKLERQNSVTGNLSLSSTRQTDKRRGRGQRGSGGPGQGRQDWQVIHDIETDGREETLARCVGVLFWVTFATFPITFTFSIAFVFDIFPGTLLRLQKSSTRPGANRHRKEVHRKQSTVSHTLYYTLYSNRVYSLPLRLSASLVRLFSRLVFSPALSIVKILHKSKATTTGITTNRKARGNNWMNAKKQNERTDR